jgi:Glycosyltransferase family 10 (fucosyltransferase) C-term
VFVFLAHGSRIDLSRTPWPQVRMAASEHNIEFLSLEEVERVPLEDAFVVADDWTREVARLVSRGARPAVLVSFDSPITAWRLYYHLEAISARFPHTFLYEGARERVAPTTWFHPLHFPVPCPPPRPTGLPWSNRRFLAALARNEALPRGLSLARTIAGLRYRPVARERYQARLRAFEFFANNDELDLFGDAWEQRHPSVAPELHAAAARAYRGSAEDTLGLLAKYRFALVYENTRFPGYVTDRILDCFFARCIPIYSGAPDIAQYVPPSAFVDVRQFQTFPELERFLVRTTEDDARRYVDAAYAFMISPAFESWCAERFARDLVEAVAHVREA